MIRGLGGNGGTFLARALVAVEGAVLLIRHPIAQYASLKSHAELQNVLTPATFLTGYLLLLERHSTAWWMR